MDFSGSLQMAAVGALCAAIGFIVAKHTHFLSSSASQSQHQVDEGKKKDRRHDVDRMAETMTDFKMVRKNLYVIFYPCLYIFSYSPSLFTPPKTDE